MSDSLVSVRKGVGDPPADPTEVGLERISSPPVVAGKQLLLDLLLLGLWIAITDWLLYRVGTYLAWGLFFVTAAAFLVIAKHRSMHRTASLATGTLLVLLSLKLMWCGSWLQVLCGGFLIVCYAMSLSGSPPMLPEAMAFLLFAVTGAAQRLRRFRFGTINQTTGVVRPFLGMQFILPAMVVTAFSSVFVLANPHLATRFADQLAMAWRSMANMVAGITPFEVVFWVVSGWLMLGLLYPAKWILMRESPPREPDHPASIAPLYQAYRNTLLSVILLFAIYLVFEFTTLWFRAFPKDFYYAGYAHRGAFWLTAALAMATLLLSVIFRSATLADRRVRFLKRLAWVWSVENLMLSAAVYNRLFIYIDFNGITRMRVIGILGITCVVVGIALVFVKLIRDHGFVWLIHRQLWVPMLAVIAYAILPVDWLVNRYNVGRVLAGNMAPAVQIIAHPTSAEGALPLMGLVQVENSIVRDGARALLALWAQELGIAGDAAAPRSNPSEVGSQAFWRSPLGHATPWLSVQQGFSQTDRIASVPALNYQAAESQLRAQLLRMRAQWSPFADSPRLRNEAIEAYFRFAYQWY